MFVIHKICNIFLITFELFAMVVHHAACHHHKRIFANPRSLFDNLPRFMVALIGDCACIHHHNVCILAKRHNLIIIILKLRCQRISLKLVKAAT